MSGQQAAQPSPRLGPRPLALHLAQALAASRHEPHLASAFLRGVHCYWRHPYRRPVDEPPARWHYGSARLLDYGGGAGPVMLAVPSLINRAYILDLMPERSLLRHLAGSGLQVWLLDWGTPGAPERRLSLAEAVLGHLHAATTWLRERTGRPPILLGYCMGGLLALAYAAHHERLLAGLALLATPWDFHCDDRTAAERIGTSALATRVAGTLGALPLALLQAMFTALDPLAVPRKFARFAARPQDTLGTRIFVATEDWLNDGVAFGAEIAHECLEDWYACNRPARSAWRLGGRTVRPERLALPCLITIPAHDQIVPKASAEALGRLLTHVKVIRPNAGHVSMVAGSNAPRTLWRPLLDWTAEIAAVQKYRGGPI